MCVLNKDCQAEERTSARSCRLWSRACSHQPTGCLSFTADIISPVTTDCSLQLSSCRFHLMVSYFYSLVHAPAVSSQLCLQPQSGGGGHVPLQPVCPPEDDTVAALPAPETLPFPAAPVRMTSSGLERRRERERKRERVRGGRGNLMQRGIGWAGEHVTKLQRLHLNESG